MTKVDAELEYLVAESVLTYLSRANRQELRALLEFL
jgi:hypothetical protein